LSRRFSVRSSPALNSATCKSNSPQTPSPNGAEFTSPEQRSGKPTAATAIRPERARPGCPAAPARDLERTTARNAAEMLEARGVEGPWRVVPMRVPALQGERSLSGSSSQGVALGWRVAAPLARKSGARRQVGQKSALDLTADLCGCVRSSGRWSSSSAFSAIATAPLPGLAARNPSAGDVNEADGEKVTREGEERSKASIRSEGAAAKAATQRERKGVLVFLGVRSVLGVRRLRACLATAGSGSPAEL
jgi:hypothetical protein